MKTKPAPFRQITVQTQTKTGIRLAKPMRVTLFWLKIAFKQEIVRVTEIGGPHKQKYPSD